MLACLNRRPIAESKVALGPQLGLTRPVGVEPGGARFIRGACECPGWASSMHVAVGVACHASEARIALSAEQQGRSLSPGGRGIEMSLLPDQAQRRELFGEMLTPRAILNVGGLIILPAGAHCQSK